MEGAARDGWAAGGGGGELVVSGRRCSDEVRAGSFCRCARRFVSFAECFYRGLCGRRGEEMRVVFRRRAVAGVCRRWCWRNGEQGRVSIACTHVGEAQLVELLAHAAAAAALSRRHTPSSWPPRHATAAAAVNGRQYIRIHIIQSLPRLHLSCACGKMTSQCCHAFSRWQSMFSGISSE